MIYQLMEVAYAIALLTLVWFMLDIAWEAMAEDAEEESWEDYDE